MEIITSLVTLQPGIHILRHPKRNLPPLSVSRAPDSAGNTGQIEILSTPMTHGTILRDGRDCIVVHVIEAPVALLVAAYLEHAGATVPALRIDQVGLDAGQEQSVTTVPDKASRSIEISGKGVSIIGHIERTGDVVASEGQSLGDPSSSLRLEGFQVMWPDRPEGVDIAYGIAVEGSGVTPIVSTGKFCGTKGEARRISEVTFALIGPNAKEYQLNGAAHFSGGFQVPVSSGMALSGPSGLEHLTSISLCVLPATQTQKKEKDAWGESARTKVFKAKTTPQKKNEATTVEVKPASKKVARSA